MLNRNDLVPQIQNFLNSLSYLTFVFPASRLSRYIDRLGRFFVQKWHEHAYERHIDEVFRECFLHESPNVSVLNRIDDFIFVLTNKVTERNRLNFYHFGGVENFFNFL